MKLSNKLYDVLKFMALILLPATAALYLGLGQLWGFPEPEKVGASLGIVSTFLGAMLHLSTKKYNKDDDSFDGYIDTDGADEDTGIPNIKLTVSKHPRDVVKGKVARFKVGPAPKPKDPELGEAP